MQWNGIYRDVRYRTNGNDISHIQRRHLPFLRASTRLLIQFELNVKEHWENEEDGYTYTVEVHCLQIRKVYTDFVSDGGVLISPLPFVVVVVVV
jgi:DNA-binding response OmpR family regulator